MRRPAILIAGLLLASGAGLGLASPASAAPDSGAHHPFPRHCQWFNGHNSWDDWYDNYWNDRWDDNYWYDNYGHCGSGRYRGHGGRGHIGVHHGGGGR